MFSIDSLHQGKSLPGARKEIPGFNRFGADPNSFWGQLQRIPAKYYLEIRRGGEVDSVISFPYDPSSMQYNRQNPHSITYTLGGVIRETSTIRAHELVFAGRSGIAQRISYTRDGGISNLTGVDAFKEFDEFLKRYTEISNIDFGVPNKLITSPAEYVQKVSQTGRASNSVQLVVRCIEEDLHLFVEPMNFTYGRAAGSNKLDIQYQLNLKAYDYAYSTAYSNAILNAIDTVDGYINAAGGALGTVANVVDNVSNDYISAVRKPLRSAASAINQVNRIPGSLGSITRNSAGIISDFVEIINTTMDIGGTNSEFNALVDNFDSNVTLETNKSAVRSLANGMLNTPGSVNDDILDVRNGVFIANMSILANESEILRGFIPRRYFAARHREADYRLGEWLSNEGNLSRLNQNGALPTGDVDRRQAFPYEIGRYDDLIQIATKLTGAASNARLLQEYNGWRDYRRNRDGDYPQPGDVVYIPNSLFIQENPFLEQGDLIGYDISVPYNDAAFNFSTDDIVLVEGGENIKQYIKHALLTVAGEIPGFETFGLRNISKINDTSYLATMIRDLLISDNRIVDVTNIVIEIEKDTVNVSLDVKTVLNNTLNFRVPYPI